MRVLSLDGGGVKGVLEARLVERMETEQPFLDQVELFAGTSTGGILALALASGLSASDCVSLYRDNAAKIFGKRDLLDTVSGGLDEYVRANYSQDGLRSVLEEAFGDRRLPDLERQVLLPCFDVARFKPKFLDKTDDWSLVDAALATSAAPTYLPVHLVREVHTAGGSRTTQRGSVRALVDGGVFANNPSERAIAFAHTKLGALNDEIRLLSLGAGATPYRPPDELLHNGGEVLDWGIRQWLVKQPHLLLKILFDGSVQVAHYSSRWQLGPHYHRVQPMLPEDVDLADAGKVNLLLAVADAHDLDGTLDWLRVAWS